MSSLSPEHTDFPTVQAEHLAPGCKENYWEPPAKHARPED